MTQDFSARSMSISYGTFSITLDGFDDPFPIMRRVTEYFRRLSSQDKSFGTLGQIDQVSAIEIVSETLRSEEFNVETSDTGMVILPRTASAEADTDTDAADEAASVPFAAILREDAVVEKVDATAEVADAPAEISQDVDEEAVVETELARVAQMPKDDDEMTRTEFVNAFLVPSSLKPTTPKLDTSSDASEAPNTRRRLRIIRSTAPEFYEEPAATDQQPDLQDTILSELRGDPTLRFGVKADSEPRFTSIPPAPPMPEKTSDTAAFSQSFKRLQLQMDEDASDELVLVANTN